MGQLPQPAEQTLRGAAAQEPSAAPHHQRRLDRHLGHRAPGSLPGDVLLASRRAGAAHLAERAHQATRRRGRADGGADVHEALVVVSGVGGGHERARQRPQLASARALERVHAGEDTLHVAVDDRHRPPERDRRDRAGGVRAEAGEPAEELRLLGQASAEPRDDLLRRAVEHARAPIVAEPRPRGEDVVERRVGQRAHRRKPLHPRLPVLDHRRHPRLLEHDLRHPDRVRIPGPAPRQIATVAAVVRQHSLRERHAPTLQATGNRQQATGNRQQATGNGRRVSPSPHCLFELPVACCLFVLS